MTTPLLITKLYIPIPPVRPLPSLVPRPRLIEQLNEGLRLGRKLILISAPAGFGKMTLASEWVHAMGGAVAPLRVAWLSLDEGETIWRAFWPISSLLCRQLRRILEKRLDRQPAIGRDFDAGT